MQKYFFVSFQGNNFVVSGVEPQTAQTGDYKGCNLQCFYNF